MRVGYVLICCSLRKCCRDRDNMIEVIEMYGSLEDLPVVLPREIARLMSL